MASYIASITRVWRNSDYDNSFLRFSNESVPFHTLMHFDKFIWKRLKHNSNITVIWRHNYVIHQFNWSMNCYKNYHSFIGSIKSSNCVSIVNILSRQNTLKTTSKALFDDVIVTSLHLSAIHYSQKIEHTPQWSLAQSFIKFGLKLRRLWRGGAESPAPFDWETSKKLELDRVKLPWWYTV